MKLAITRLYYGADYLPYVIRSTEGFADKHIVLYTSHVSAGFHQTTLPVPEYESRDNLYQLAKDAGGDRLEWHDDLPIDVNMGRVLYPDADFCLELDADEVLHEALADHILKLHAEGRLTAGRYYVPFLHYWRSFRTACWGGNPHRLYVYTDNNDVADLPDCLPTATIAHFGYARTIQDMRFKLSISAHKNEFVLGWFGDTFLGFPQKRDAVHPVDPPFWKVVDVGEEYLPCWMADHPYRNLEVIE